jgi:hypothetical protein
VPQAHRIQRAVLDLGVLDPRWDQLHPARPAPLDPTPRRLEALGVVTRAASGGHEPALSGAGVEHPRTGPGEASEQIQPLGVEAGQQRRARACRRGVPARKAPLSWRSPAGPSVTAVPQSPQRHRA